VHLRVTANKNGRLVESVLQGEAAGRVAQYVRQFRPLGPHPETDWLFPNRDGTDRPRSKNGFSGSIADVIYEHTGLRVTVHVFRSFVAALILADNPNALEDVRALLGHGSFEIALRHYRRTNRQGAAQRLSDAIVKRRQRSKAAAGPVLARLDGREVRRRSARA
jgi:integrase